MYSAWQKNAPRGHEIGGPLVNLHLLLALATFRVVLGVLAMGIFLTFFQARVFGDSGEVNIFQAKFPCLENIFALF
jgi:hypothetical protein